MLCLQLLSGRFRVTLSHELVCSAHLHWATVVARFQAQGTLNIQSTLLLKPILMSLQKDPRVEVKLAALATWLKILAYLLGCPQGLVQDIINTQQLYRGLPAAAAALQPSREEAGASTAASPQSAGCKGSGFGGREYTRWVEGIAEVVLGVGEGAAAAAAVGGSGGLKKGKAAKQPRRSPSPAPAAYGPNQQQQQQEQKQVFLEGVPALMIALDLCIRLSGNGAAAVGLGCSAPVPPSPAAGVSPGPVHRMRPLANRAEVALHVCQLVQRHVAEGSSALVSAAQTSTPASVGAVDLGAFTLESSYLVAEPGVPLRGWLQLLSRSFEVVVTATTAAAAAGGWLWGQAGRVSWLTLQQQVEVKPGMVAAGGLAGEGGGGIEQPQQNPEGDAEEWVDLWEVWLPAWQQMIQRLGDTAAVLRSGSGRCVDNVDSTQMLGESEGLEHPQQQQRRLVQLQQERQCQQQQQSIVQGALTTIEEVVAAAKVRKAAAMGSKVVEY